MPEPAPPPPSRVTVRCPRCPATFEVPVTFSTTLTYTAGMADKAFIGVRVDTGGIEHTCPGPDGGERAVA